MKLTIISGPETGSKFELAPGNNFIGRAEENSVVLRSTQVSRRHACLTWINGQFFLEDLGSSNGTHINGVRLAQKTELPSTSPFQVGDFVLQFVSDETYGASTSPYPAASYGQSAFGAAPEMAVSPELYGSHASSPSPYSPYGAGGGPILQMGLAGLPRSDTPFWKVYDRIAFLGWRGHLILMGFLTVLMVVGVGIYPLLLANQRAMTQEVLKRGEVLVNKLAMRNGEFIRDRLETNLDTSSFLGEQGVGGAFLLSKELTILSPVEQRGKSKANDVSREALRGGLVKKEEPEVQSSGQAGIYHIATPIKVWSNELGNYETHGVAYLVLNARQIVDTSAASDVKFIASTLLTIITISLFVAAIILLTTKPIQALQEDAELALRGDLRSVESRARWSELSALANSLNRSLDRFRASAASAAPPTAPDHSASGHNAGASGATEPILKAIATAVPDALLLIDNMQRVAYLNGKAEKLFSASLGRSRNRHIMEVIKNKEVLGAILDLLKQLLASDEPIATANVPLSDGGGNRKVNIVVAGVKGSDMQLDYAAIVIR